MTAPYTEVIGDPVAHSLSPAIHTYWLRQIGLPGAYRATRCTAADLPAYLADRAVDPAWRGCNLTMPLKEAAWRLATQDEPILSIDDDARAMGAVNCIARTEDGLHARNTDVDGVRAALGNRPNHDGHAVIIGAGGAARAALIALAERRMRTIILARSPAKAPSLRNLSEATELADLAYAPAAFADASIIINATPLGMDNGPLMPRAILDALSVAKEALVVDMVYRPLRTAFLAAAEASGLATADGLTMLIGQARPSFRFFFGAMPPVDEAALRDLLIARLRAG